MVGHTAPVLAITRDRKANTWCTADVENYVIGHGQGLPPQTRCNR